MYTYLIQLGGAIDVDELNPHSPRGMTVAAAPLGPVMGGPGEAEAGPAAVTTWISVCTDQSGLIGLVRYLHGRGLELLCVTRSR